MTIHDKIKDEQYTMILIKTLQNYQPYHQAKLINMNILQMKNYCLLIKKK